MKNSLPKNWEWESSASDNTLLMLLALAHFGKKNSVGIHYTGTAVDLARLTKLNVRTAQRAIKQLIESGIIEKVNDNMSLGVSGFLVQTATICRLGKKDSDNMSLESLSPNEDRDINIDNIYNSKPLSKEQINYIKEKFKNVDIDLEIEKFKDYWLNRPKPDTWSGYRRLLTWLDKAERNNNERFNSRRFSKGKANRVSNNIDERTRRIAEQQERLRQE